MQHFGLHAATIKPTHIDAARKWGFFSPVKTQPMIMPQWFILMDKLLIYQIKFQSASSCAKTGPRKEKPFVWDRKF